MVSKADLESFRIPNVPTAGYYIPSFVSLEEERRIVEEIHRLPTTRWTQLSHRRLLSLPSQLTGTARDTLISANIPSFLESPVLPRLKSLGMFSLSPHAAPNHVLVNEYHPGQGIMPHEDGPAYYPITATVSLKSHAVLNIYRKNDQGEREQQPTWRILQEPGSLLVTTADMYRDTLHGIEEVEEDNDLSPETVANWNLLGSVSPYESGRAQRELRISLTYRDVSKVAKLGGAMKFMGKR